METNNTSFLNSVAAVVLILLIGTSSFYYKALFSHDTTSIIKNAVHGSKETATSSQKEVPLSSEAPRKKVNGTQVKALKEVTKESVCLNNFSVLKEKINERAKMGYGTYTLTPSNLVIGYNKKTNTCIGGFVTSVISSTSSVASLPTMYFIVTVDSNGITPLSWSKEKSSFSLEKDEYIKSIVELSDGSISIQ
jgi:hypothetical protein